MASDITKINPVIDNRTQHPKYKNVQTLIKAMRSESTQFFNRDLVTEFNQSAHMQSRDNKSPTIQFLTVVEDDLKNINAHMGATNKVGQQYAKLLHNQTVLDNTESLIQKQTMTHTLRDAQRPPVTDVYSGMPLDMVFTPQENPKASPAKKAEGNTDAIPTGVIQTQNQPVVPYSTAQFEIHQPPQSYPLSSGYDIFSSPNNGRGATYKIVPFDLIAGA